MRTGNLSFNGKWVELPTLTTTERNALSTPKVGYEVYNLTSLQIESYNGSIWTASSGGGATGLQGVTGPSGIGATGMQGVTGVGNYSYTTTFTNATLSSGILTVTHGLGTKNLVTSVKDNNDKDIAPDDITSTTTTVAVDLKSYGTITGTWSITTVASGGLPASATLQQAYNLSLSQPQITATPGLGGFILKGATGADASVAFGVQRGNTGTNAFTVTGAGVVTMAKESTAGIMVDPVSPTWGWRDMLGVVQARTAGSSAPSWNTWRGTVSQYQFTTTLNEVTIEFHIPHDYVPGTDLFVHTHWSHITAGTPTGAITWSYDHTYAKGHNQATFPVTKTLNSASTVASVQYQHVITETQISNSGGTGNLFDTALVEVDGIIVVRAYWSANTLSGATNPFVHFVDIHYQSNGMSTKNKAPNFYA